MPLLIHDNEPVTWVASTLLRDAGVGHGFSTRRGGVSRPPYDSLNLGHAGSPAATPDSDANVAANARRWASVIGCLRHKPFTVRQVHGGGVWAVPPSPACNPSGPPDADAMITASPQVALTIRIADCAPVLLATDDGAVVATAHAGWRGVVAGIVPSTVRAMHERFGAPPGRLRVAIGPCIGLRHFEVGPEVAAAFEAADLGEAVRRDIGVKPHIDLVLAISLQLQRVGIAESAIDAPPGDELCTFAREDLFFSHRRDHGVTGRMAATIACG